MINLAFGRAPAEKAGSGYPLLSTPPITIGVCRYRFYPSRNQGNILLKSRHKDSRKTLLSGQKSKKWRFDYSVQNIAFCEPINQVIRLIQYLQMDFYPLISNSKGHYFLKTASLRCIKKKNPANTVFKRYHESPPILHHPSLRCYSKKSIGKSSYDGTNEQFGIRTYFGA